MVQIEVKNIFKEEKVMELQANIGLKKTKKTT